MLTATQGVYRKGKIELEQKPENISDETRRHRDLFGFRRGGFAQAWHQ